MVAKSIKDIIDKQGGDCVWDGFKFKNIRIAYREEFDYIPTIYFENYKQATCDCLIQSFGEIKQYLAKHPDVEEVLCRINENGTFFLITPSQSLDVVLYNAIKTRRTICNNQMGKPFSDEELALVIREEFHRYRTRTHTFSIDNSKR